jgi:hypothetical protein
VRRDRRVGGAARGFGHDGEPKRVARRRRDDGVAFCGLGGGWVMMTGVLFLALIQLNTRPLPS